MSEHTSSAPEGYELLGVLGRGAGSTVREARRTATGETVALTIYDVDVPVNGIRAALKVTQEPSHWSAHRDLVNEYGFGVFDVDPGRGLRLVETSPGVTEDDVRTATGAPFRSEVNAER